jgi:hypothetical protein
MVYAIAVADISAQYPAESVYDTMTLASRDGWKIYWHDSVLAICTPRVTPDVPGFEPDSDTYICDAREEVPPTVKIIANSGNFLIIRGSALLLIRVRKHRFPSEPIIFPRGEW